MGSRATWSITTRHDGGQFPPQLTIVGEHGGWGREGSPTRFGEDFAALCRADVGQLDAAVRAVLVVGPGTRPYPDLPRILHPRDLLTGGRLLDTGDDTGRTAWSYHLDLGAGDLTLGPVTGRRTTIPLAVLRAMNTRELDSLLRAIEDAAAEEEGL